MRFAERRAIVALSVGASGSTITLRPSISRHLSFNFRQSTESRVSNKGARISTQKNLRAVLWYMHNYIHGRLASNAVALKMSRACLAACSHSARPRGEIARQEHKNAVTINTAGAASRGRTAEEAIFAAVSRCAPRSRTRPPQKSRAAAPRRAAGASPPAPQSRPPQARRLPLKKPARFFGCGGSRHSAVRLSRFRIFFKAAASSSGSDEDARAFASSRASGVKISFNFLHIHRPSDTPRPRARTEHVAAARPSSAACRTHLLFY